MLILSLYPRSRPANSGLAQTTERERERISYVLPTGVYDLGGAPGKQLRAWKSNCSTVSPPLLPKLEFVLFAQLSRNLQQQQEVHAGLSPPAETEHERERETFRTDPTPRRLSEGQDGWRPSLTNGQTRASNTKQQMNFLVTDEINVRRSQWDVGSTEKETNGGKDKKQIKKKRK